MARPQLVTGAVARYLAVCRQLGTVVRLNVVRNLAKFDAERAPGQTKGPR